MKNLSAIFAMSSNGVIGKQKTLENGAVDFSIPWYLPRDLKQFKNVTTGNIVVMGRHTWESLPFRPLPGRSNRVLSRRRLLLPRGVVLMNDTREVLQFANGQPNEEIIIMGGAQVYNAFFPYVSKLYVTVVDIIIEDPDSPDEQLVYMPAGCELESIKKLFKVEKEDLWLPDEKNNIPATYYEFVR